MGCWWWFWVEDDFGIGDGASVLVVGGGCFCLLTVLVIVIYPRVIKSLTDVHVVDDGLWWFWWRLSISCR